MAYPNKTNFGIIVCTTNIDCFIKQRVITTSNNAELTGFFTHHRTFKTTIQQFSGILTTFTSVMRNTNYCVCKVQSVLSMSQPCSAPGLRIVLAHPTCVEASHSPGAVDINGSESKLSTTIFTSLSSSN